VEVWSLVTILQTMPFAEAKKSKMWLSLALETIHILILSFVKIRFFLPLKIRLATTTSVRLPTFFFRRKKAQTFIRASRERSRWQEEKNVFILENMEDGFLHTLPSRSIIMGDKTKLLVIGILCLTLLGVVAIFKNDSCENCTFLLPIAALIGLAVGIPVPSNLFNRDTTKSIHGMC